MRALVWLGGDKFEIQNIDLPKLKDEQVLVCVEKVGLCGTDVHITQGLFPSDPPKILGHEFSGTIVDVGSKVSKDLIGKRVACNTTSSCGKCKNCENWQISRCINAEKTTGAFAEYSIMHYSAAVEIPDNMSFDVAAMTEPASCCFSGTEMIDYQNKPRVLIFGAGIMGIFCQLFLMKKNIEFIAISEPNDLRRNVAKELGADHIINPLEKNYEGKLQDLTDGNGFDVFIEAVGKPELLTSGISHLSPRGQALMIGVHPEQSNLMTDLYDFHYREIRLFGAFGRGNYFNDTPKKINEFALEKLVSKTYKLDEINDAIRSTAMGEGMKYMISPKL
tara:strand:- start:16091 stop:17092 length:1002 start_codon:yes stop_codon:yes gene_type:complete